MSTYPEDAACAKSRDRTLWDAKVHGETLEHREWRHHQARAICRRCPVSRECALAIDWQWDEGVRAGELLPEKKTAARPARERREIAHGTEAGYKAHKRREERPCSECRAGNASARRERDARRAVA